MVGAGRGRARPGRHRPGRRAGQGGARPGRSGSGTVGVGAAGEAPAMWKRCEREKREKERAGPNILAYVRWADTSTDEHKRAGLRGDCDALCSSATQRT
jgi:hypothetical protein